MATPRRPRPALSSNPIPTLERVAAALAFGAVAVAGCDNPFAAESEAVPSDRSVSVFATAPAPPVAPPVVAAVTKPGPVSLPRHSMAVAGGMPRFHPTPSPLAHAASLPASPPRRRP